MGAVVMAISTGNGRFIALGCINVVVAHLKWTWVIALGYAASIGVHWVMNSHLFNP